MLPSKPKVKCGIILGNMTISLKTLLISLGILLLLIFGTWFSLEKIILFYKLNSPVPKNWQSVHMTNGDVYYGKISGTLGSTLNLSSPYHLEKLNKSEALEKSDQLNATSSSFGFNGSPNISEEKYILVEKQKNMLINRSQILFIQEVSSDEEVSKYLK